MAFIALWLLGYATGATADEQATVDALLSQASKHLYSAPEKALAPLEKLHALRSTFTPAQNEKYHLIYANSLGFRGQYAERVALVEGFIGQVKTPGRRASFLYELIDGYTALGQYEKALQAMNESILLLPSLEKAGDKITVLQAAIATTSAFKDYDEALDFAERIYSLRGAKAGSYAACVGLTDKVELLFMRESRAEARALVQEAIDACDANKNQFFTLITKTHAAIDQIDSGKYTAGIATSLPLLKEHAVLNRGSDYVTQLEEAVARAYLKSGNTERAEYYGQQAYQRAQAGNILSAQKKTSETMAAIKRAQGALAAAVTYYDTSLELHKKALNDQLQKNMAYQRVRFNTQDQANQLALLQQSNKSLGTEKALQQGVYQNLILLVTLGAVVLAIVGTWLVRTSKQKNMLRLSAQVDGLTQVSNRAHFQECSQQVFKNTRQPLSLILFDMDYFKKINDTYGHAAGDWVLRTVCDTVKLHLRKTDVFGRLGGEEFAICLPQSTGSEAYALTERCRAAIAAIDSRPSGLSFEITASFGIATRDAGGQLNFEETLAAADKALYLSKNEGRNRVTTYQASGNY